MKQHSGHLVDILFTLALFCVFSVCALMVVIMGADVYSKSVDDMQRNFDERTSLAYIATKLRQNDSAWYSSASQTMEGGVQALVLNQTIDDTAYRTWIYCYDGQLREIFTLAGLQPAPQEGQPIMELADLAVEQVDAGHGLVLRLTATGLDGRQSQLCYSLRSRSVFTSDTLWSHSGEVQP